MARPKKIGLEYFPMDCVLDAKIEMLEVEFGNDGFTVWVKILQQCYMTEIGELDISDVLRRKTLAKKANITVELWNNIVETMVSINLFDNLRYKEDQILTSNGIKARITKVSKERGNAIERAKKSLLEKKNSFAAQNDRSSPQNDRISTQSKSKSKSNKKENIKKDFTNVVWPFDSQDFKKVWETWETYRKEIKADPYKPVGLQMTLSELKNLSDGDEAKAVRLVHYAMSHGWKGFFKPNDKEFSQAPSSNKTRRTIF